MSSNDEKKAPGEKDKPSKPSGGTSGTQNTTATHTTYPPHPYYPYYAHPYYAPPMHFPHPMYHPMAPHPGYVAQMNAAAIAASSSSTSKGTSAASIPRTPPKASTPGKKRPYRRTKRPKNYCDKSTITTTTNKMVALNAYDAVLAESDDLLLAAAEAQRLGRLKMASAYLLLLHARLVGLGKRFDKAKQEAKTPSNPSASLDPTGTPLNAPTPDASTPSTAIRKFASMLPSNIEMDQAMMEHLAAAAVELHASRSGRTVRTPRHESEAATGVSYSEFLAQTANEQNITNAATASGSAVIHNEKEGSEWEDGEKEATGNTMKKKSGNVKKKDDDDSKNPDNSESPLRKKSGGRGRKPTTTAMNTNPQASCNARLLLQGNLLRTIGSKEEEIMNEEEEQEEEQVQQAGDTKPVGY